MSGIGSTGPFTGFYESAKPNLDTQGNKHVRGEKNGEGLTLYTHKNTLLPEFTSTRQLREKHETGATILKQWIDEEYGHGVGEKIFGRVGQMTERDLMTGVLLKDVSLMKQELSGMTPLNPRFVREPSGNFQNQRLVFGLRENEEPGHMTEDRETMRLGLERELTESQIKGLGGIPDRCYVDVEYNEHNFGLVEGQPGILTIDMNGKDPGGAFSDISTVLYRDLDGKLCLLQRCSETQGKTLKQLGDIERPQGLLVSKIAKQVVTGRSLGVEKLYSEPSRKGRSTQNDAYVLALCGGNAPLTKAGLVSSHGDGVWLTKDYELDRLEWFRKALEQSTSDDLRKMAEKEDLTLHDLMATKEGRKLWQSFGFPTRFEFDLRDDSTTMLMLQDYALDHSCFGV